MFWIFWQQTVLWGVTFPFRKESSCSLERLQSPPKIKIRCSASTGGTGRWSKRHKRAMPVMVRRKMGRCCVLNCLSNPWEGGWRDAERKAPKKNHVRISPKSRRPSQANTGAIHRSEAKQARKRWHGRTRCSCVRRAAGGQGTLRPAGFLWAARVTLSVTQAHIQNVLDLNFLTKAWSKDLVTVLTPGFELRSVWLWSTKGADGAVAWHSASIKPHPE